MNLHTLLEQGKLTPTQYIRMVKQELHIMKLTHEYRLGTKKAHTDK